MGVGHRSPPKGNEGGSDSSLVDSPLSGMYEALDLTSAPSTNFLKSQERAKSRNHACRGPLMNGAQAIDGQLTVSPVNTFTLGLLRTSWTLAPPLATHLAVESQKSDDPEIQCVSCEPILKTQCHEIYLPFFFY